jgi:predicted RNase H-like nuclease (RuvC/YqgF family)
MPVNKTHTTRIEALEKEHALYFASNQQDKMHITSLLRRVKEFEDEQSRLEVRIEQLVSDIEFLCARDKETMLHQDSLYTELETVCKQVENMRTSLESSVVQFNTFSNGQVSINGKTNEKIDAIIEKEVDDAFYLTDLHTRLQHVELANNEYLRYIKQNKTQPTLLQLFKAVLYIPFTTVTKGL